MIGPVTRTPNATWCRRWRQKNIVQEVETLHIAALELQSRQAAGRLEIRKTEGTKARNRIEVFKNHYAIKDDTKPVVWRGAGLHDLIEKAEIVESTRRRGEGLADGVKIGTVRTKECAESIVGRRHLTDAKVTSIRRRCGGPASE